VKVILISHSLAQVPNEAILASLAIKALIGARNIDRWGRQVAN